MNQFDKTSKEFIASYTPQPNPADPANPLIRPNSTNDPLPDDREGCVHVFTSSTNIGNLHSGYWTTVEDNRGKKVYSKTDKTELEITELGTIPNTHTKEAPQSQYDEWDEKSLSWVVNLDSELSAYKLKNEGDVSLKCKVAINGSFTSTALGSSHDYPCWEDHSANHHDQSNIRNAYAALQAGSAVEYINCSDDNGNAFREHTEEQAAVVVRDMQTHIQTKRQYLAAKISDIDDAISIEEVDNIVNSVVWP